MLIEGKRIGQMGRLIICRLAIKIFLIKFSPRVVPALYFSLRSTFSGSEEIITA
jgi:hypothetical protein